MTVQIPDNMRHAEIRDVIVISGLRRSGTTALWQCFRGAGDIAAFDEPFHPHLAAGERSNNKGTWTELAAFLDSSGEAPVAIATEDELASAPTIAETAYFDRLSHAAPRVAMDVVRCWNRLPALYPEPSRVLTVHLVRDPGSWVTAHLLPSGRGTWRKSLADNYRRASFFARRGLFNNYHYENVIAAALEQDHALWRSVTMPIAELRRAPAYVKLLAFWWGANLATHQALVQAGVPGRVVTLAEFSGEPRRVLGEVAEIAGWEATSLRCDHVAPTRPPFRPAHPAWVRAARALGIPAGLFAAGGTTAATLEAAFNAALASGRMAR